jgi:hypothetical protein
MPSLRFFLVPATAAVALLLGNGTAHADCAEGAAYSASVNGSTVTLCGQDLDGKNICSYQGGVVRQDEATDEVDQLASYCPNTVDNDAGVMVTVDAGDTMGSTCFVDECVPPGEYRYGLASPFDCSQAGCGSSVPLFVQVRVTATLPAGCKRSSGDAAPTKVSSAPWGSGTDPSDEKTCGSGCSTTASRHVGILSADATMLLVGVALWFRTRRRSRRA